MDAVSQSQAASSANTVNQILELAVQATTKQAEKLMKVAVTLGIEAGKGENIDVFA
jgi:hypothetical protein